MDKKSPIPVYYQLAEEIREKIKQGVWLPGDCIDSERVLSEEYQLSRMTVRQAIGELVQSGVLTREKGKGTFVCEPKVKQRDIMSFTEIMKSSGLELRTEVICFEVIEADEDMYSLFSINEIYKIERLRFVYGLILAKETIFIPCQYVPGLKKSDLVGSFYEILDKNDLSVDSSEASIQAVLINDYYKGLFRLNENVPLLKVGSKNYSAEGKLIFVEDSIYRSDKYTLETNITRKKGKIK